MTKFNLGIYLGTFARNRFPEPEIWTKLVGRELGIKYVQFSTDLLNPICIPREIQKKENKSILENCRKNNIKVLCCFTGFDTRTNLVTHPKQYWRSYAEQFYKALIRHAQILRADSSGGNFCILSVHDLVNRKKYLIQEAIKSYRRLRIYAQKHNLKYIYFEPMSVPREFPCTIRDTFEMLEQINDGPGVPMRLLLDVAHGFLASSEPEDRDPYAWLQKLGQYAPIIHIKQTDRTLEPRWPFTKEYNKYGIVHPERVLEVLAASGAEQVTLIFEIPHRERLPYDECVIDDHKRSVEYWRRFVDK